MDLLGTIKIPRGNMRLLQGKLPTAQYEQEEEEVKEEENESDDDFKREDPS